jgi:hypothetical protein
VTISYGDASAAVTPSRVQFTSQAIGTVGERTVTVTNRGEIPLDVTGTTLAGFGAGDFQVGPGCSAPIPVGASCQIVVRFAPRTEGRREAKLTIASNARFGDRAVFLAGYGRPAPKPVLSALRISPSTFKAAKRGKSIAARGKATVTYRADVAGTATFRVLRVKTSVRNGKRRTRLVPIGASFTHAAHAGANRFRFTGRVKDIDEMVVLRPGRYRLRATGARSVSAAFRIARS